METAPAGSEGRGIEYDGRWQEYLELAAVNLLLTIVTLGIYRFWATARSRRYLWSRTRLVGSDLEWAGTGGEMFIGFLMVMGILVGWGAVVFFLAKINPLLLLVGFLAFYIFVFWAIGFAQFRALRYRLSRTYWRGIRGGSDDSGVGYGWRAFGRTLLAGLSVGIATPWALTENWNDRVNAMSFGDREMTSALTTEGLWLRWFGVIAAYVVFVVALFSSMPDLADPNQPPAQLQLGLAYWGGLLLVMVAGIAFYAEYFRRAAETWEWAGLTARFDASTLDWFTFYAKIIGLTLVTLGIGALVVPHLHWKFVMDRLAMFGDIYVDEIGQSRTRAPTDAEGFADAFDIGAF